MKIYALFLAFCFYLLKMAPLLADDFADGLPSVEDIQDRVNKRYDELFIKDKNGKSVAPVCCICDEFLMTKQDFCVLTPKKLKAMKEPLSWTSMEGSDRILALEDVFCLKDDTGLISDTSWLQGMALSPRGRIFKKPGKGRRAGFTCCPTCKSCVDRSILPMNAIINKNYVGGAPQCLTDLTEVEQALITPVKHHGYCFTWTGGRQKCMKGTLVFMRVKERRVAQAVTQLEAMGLTKHIIVLGSGNMTTGQRKKVRDKCIIRTDKVIAAVEWLCANHKIWKDINLEEMKEGIRGVEPVVLDHSDLVESENANVEEEELFSCYYPEGAATPESGGFDQTGAFKKFVEEMHANEFDLEFTANLQQAFVKADDNDQLIGACLLQFPYGVGGMAETRLTADGSLTDKSDLRKFLGHLSRLSQPSFQTPLFQLIAYTLISKTRLLNSSRLQLKGEEHAKNLAEGLNARDLGQAIHGRRGGNRTAGTNVSRNLLDAVDACSRSLPHTNDAAKKARGVGESMQHRFGDGSVFLTVTFDDENSLLLQILTDNRVDDDRPVEGLSDGELHERAKARESIRLKFPGATAVHFEMLLNILTEEVIGWDLNASKPTEQTGYFGNVYAFTMAVEEQGRKTLHGHMTLWIEKYNELQRTLFFGNPKPKRDAARNLQKYYDHVATTTLMTGDTTLLRKAFDHDGCSAEKRRRELPRVVDDQGLRGLRHKHGYQASEGVFAVCPEEECAKTWTYETLLADYLKNGELYCQPVGAQDANNDFDFTHGDKTKSVPKDRLRAEVVKFQKQGITPEDAPSTLINTLYQHHKSCHVSSCFKCNKKKGKHVCTPKCECRYRLPDRRRIVTCLKMDYEKAPWYEWTGEEKTQPICQLLPKRGTYDLFQNVSCPGISESKMACNSNVSLILAGPIAQYQFKYQLKGTQDDDTAEYEKVHYSIKNVTGRVHESNRSEAMRLICRAAFAHNKTNVISAPMASYLIRNNQRFYFSHTVLYCPLNDVIKLHEKKAVSGLLKFTADGESFFENQALHYLCRPISLADDSLLHFIETYYVLPVTGGRKRSKNLTKVQPFLEDTGYFQHPSGIEDKEDGRVYCKQGVRERKEKVIAKVSQWMFPDTADFRTPIMTCSREEMNPKMEKYAQLVLTLLMPHRCVDDLTIGNDTSPYTRKLQEVYAADELRKQANQLPKVFTQENCEFLQNIQNCAYNALRYRIKTDDLEACTQPFTSNEIDMKNTDDEEEEEEDQLDYESLLEQLDVDEQAFPNDDKPEYLNQALKGFTFKKIRNKGVKKCGYIKELEAPDICNVAEGDEPFVRTVPNRGNTAHASNGPSRGGRKQREVYGVKRIVTVFLRRTQQKVRHNVWEGKDIKVTDANGSIESIREWGEAAFSLDKKQRRAFETMVSAFVLTFYEGSEDAEVQDDPDNSERSKYRQMEKALMELKGHKTNKQLIGLLHGPGGSGKSTVINMVKAYAQAYCDSLGHQYTRRTIIVTAMSGVAATILGGETTHSVFGLNRRKAFDEDEKDAFLDCRLIIIDEISFASSKNFEKIQKNIATLLRKRYHVYGGTNIVFAGDYSQLEPVGQTTVYSGKDCAEFHLRVNSYIELDGTWRFKDDPEWGARMLRFREGVPTRDDINTINDSCSIDVKPPPNKIQVATHRNRDRDAINASIFEEYCKAHKPPNDEVLRGAVVVFMDDLEINTSKKTFVPIQSNAVKRHFYEHCAEDDCKMGDNGRGRVDPLLKLYAHCPMMLTLNNDVPNGQANGSRVTVEGVNVKAGEQPFQLETECGTTVLALYASQVKSITVKHENDEITPNIFEVDQENWSFLCSLTIGTEVMKTGMKGYQFPLISNSCTTGHKLQGCTVDSLLVNDWHYGQNWTYVVLSRVKKMSGLYLRNELSTDLSKYAMDTHMLAMLDTFRRSVPLTILHDADYNRLLHATAVTSE